MERVYVGIDWSDDHHDVRVSFPALLHYYSFLSSILSLSPLHTDERCEIEEIRTHLIQAPTLHVKTKSF